MLERRVDRLKILLVEDHQSDADLIARELRRAQVDCELRRVQTESEMLLGLRDFAPHVILSDHSLPQFSARDALRLARRECPDVPVIVVTGSLDEETAADYIKAGAVDYIVKERIYRLGPAVQRAVDLTRARAEQALAEADRERLERRFRRLIEHSSDVIALTDERGVIRYCSQSILGVLGLVPDGVLGRSMFDLHHGDDVPRARRTLAAALIAPGRAARAEVRIRHHDGAWREFEIAMVNRLTEPEVAAVVVTHHDVTERKHAEAALRASEERFRALAVSDPLTGLANYRHLLTVLEAELRRSDRTGRTFAVLFLDLDHLKRINDKYGHLVGSRALCRLADVLRRTCRAVDTAARFGGDEFAIVLPEADRAAARRVARRVMEDLAADGEVPRISVSIGYAVFPSHARTIKDLLAAADQALYAAKARGRGGRGGRRARAS